MFFIKILMLTSKILTIRIYFPTMGILLVSISVIFRCHVWNVNRRVLFCNPSYARVRVFSE